MSNEIKTRRLVVSVANIVGEEADTIASEIEEKFQHPDHGYDVTVTHALGETLPDNVRVRSLYEDFVQVGFPDGGDPTHFGGVPNGGRATKLSLYEARQLAGALLSLPGVAEAEAPELFRVVGSATYNVDTDELED